MKKLLAILLVAAMVSVMAVTTFAENYDLTDEEKFTFGTYGGAGVECEGTTIIFDNGGTAVPTAPAYWSSANLNVNDDVKDGFTVKISNIDWDESENNPAVLIAYGNTDRAHPMRISATTTTMNLMVMENGDIFFWGDGISSNHFFGKWAPILVTGKTLGAPVTEFTYKMVPNADKTVYSFYVNDVFVYDYDVSLAPTQSIFTNTNTPCNFGFLVANANGANNSYDALPTGKLSYTVAEVSSTGVVENNDDIGGGNDDIGGGNDDIGGGNANTGDMTWAVAAVAVVALMGCAVVATKKRSSER